MSKIDLSALDKETKQRLVKYCKLHFDGYFSEKDLETVRFYFSPKEPTQPKWPWMRHVMFM